MKLRSIVIAVALALPTSVVGQQKGTASRDDVTFDFQDVDVKIVITAIAEAGKLNVSYSALPPRLVTLRTSQPIARGGMQALLKSVTESNGLMLVEDGPLLRVAPAPDPVLQARPGLAQARQADPQDTVLNIHRLKHARASRIALTIQALFGGVLSYVGDTQQSRPSLSQQLRSLQIPTGYPQPISQPVAPIGEVNRNKSDLQIIADESTNSLLVRASAADWLRVREAIDALDVRPLQVLIEVIIAEVRRSSEHNLGVSVEAPQTRSRFLRGTVGGTVGQETTGDIVLKLHNVGAIDARAVLSAMSAKSNVSILSRPVILAHNNAQARIMVGSQRPFVQVVRALPTESAVRDQIVQYRDVGTSLTLIPTINPDGYVTLELLQEISAATNETQFGAPVISTREASTQLLVRDGQTAVIGGLIDRQSEDVRGGIPLLKDIPLIGRAFGLTRKNKFNTELFLFITPRVVKTDEDVDAVRKGIEHNTEMLDDLLRKRKPLVPDTIIARRN